MFRNDKNFNHYLLIAIVDTRIYLCTKIHDILLDSTSPPLEKQHNPTPGRLENCSSFYSF